MTSKSLKDPVLFLILSLYRQSLVLFLWQVSRHPPLPLRGKKEKSVAIYIHSRMHARLWKVGQHLAVTGENNEIAKHEKFLKET